MLLLTACGSRGLSAEQMQQKLDSIRKIEIAERLEAP